MGQRKFEEQREKDYKTGKALAEEQHEKRMRKMEIDQKIEFSKSTNDARIKKMVERNEQLKKCRDEIKESIKESIQDKRAYQETLQKMIVQGMIKLLDEEIELKIRAEDRSIVE